MRKSICIYLHAHQPRRLTKINFLNIANNKDLYEGILPNSNQKVVEKVIFKSYKPMIALVRKLISKFDFKISLSTTSTLLDQFKKYDYSFYEDFIDFIKLDNVEMVAETSHHTLASLYNEDEFIEQSMVHKNLLEDLSQNKISTYRNTELIYNDRIADLVESMGFETIITEGWHTFLDWRSCNFVYTANSKNKKLALLLKNYKLSDDIAFRFSNPSWENFPLTVKKYIEWLNGSEGDLVNLFMDFETFGEHQWEHTGIFLFFEKLVSDLNKKDYQFLKINETERFVSKDVLEVPNTISWADSERDVSAWNGNKMQQEAISKIYSLSEKMIAINKLAINRKRYFKESVSIINEWRNLQTSDHFYYMSTKNWGDGDVHEYFSPYESPYDAFINYMSVYSDFEKRIRLFEENLK